MRPRPKIGRAPLRPMRPVIDCSGWTGYDDSQTNGWRHLPYRSSDRIPSGIRRGRKFFTFALIAFCSGAVSQAAAVDIHPGEDIPTVVAANPAGTTFVIYPGTYRLKQNIVPKTGDRFIGQTAGAPPTTSCRAIISGSTVIGSLAKFDGTQKPTTRAAFLRWR
jgi:hypothetical protein